MDEPARRLELIAADWADCTACTASERRSNEIIFGRGVVPADILLVGTYPAKDDIIYNSAFSDPAGDLLGFLMDEEGIDQDKVFYTYLLGCQPTVVIPGVEGARDTIDVRKPAKDEIEACLPRVHEIIYQVDPRIIITCGIAPLKALASNGTRIGTISGQTGKMFQAWVPGRQGPVRYPLIAMYELSTLITKPSTAEHDPPKVASRVLRQAQDYINWTLERLEE